MLKARLRDALVLGAAALLLGGAGGCFGRFRAMNAVYDFNKSASDSTVVRSLLMCGLLIIPVYEVSFLADAIVLNVVDFLNGTGQVARDERLPDGSRLRLARVDADTVRVRHVDPQGRERAVDVVRVGASAGYVRAVPGEPGASGVEGRGAGRILGAVERLPDGRLLERAP
jgi:hypothetical protein